MEDMENQIENTTKQILENKEKISNFDVIKDIHENMEKKYINYIPSTAKQLIHNTQSRKVSIEDVIKEHNNRWRVNVSELDMPEIIKAIQEDDIYLDDYELVDGYVQAKVYLPFTCLFETSGKVVIENDLRDFFEEADFNVNSSKGIIETMEFYSKNKMLHGFVGNSCPGVYLNKDLGTINIGCDYDEDDERILPSGFEPIASICTDLWWYSIIDLEVLKGLDPNFDESNWTIVDIPAGTWKLTHKYGISERGYHENLPYATMELIK